MLHRQVFVMSASSCQYTPMESNGTLPAAVSNIHPDICANITIDIHVCINGTGNVHTFCECDGDGVWTIIQIKHKGLILWKQ